MSRSLLDCVNGKGVRVWCKCFYQRVIGHRSVLSQVVFVQRAETATHTFCSASRGWSVHLPRFGREVQPGSLPRRSLQLAVFTVVEYAPSTAPGWGPYRLVSCRRRWAARPHSHGCLRPRRPLRARNCSGPLRRRHPPSWTRSPPSRSRRAAGAGCAVGAVQGQSAWQCSNCLSCCEPRREPRATTAISILAHSPRWLSPVTTLHA